MVACFVLCVSICDRKKSVYDHGLIQAFYDDEIMSEDCFRQYCV